MATRHPPSPPRRRDGLRLRRVPRRRLLRGRHPDRGHRLRLHVPAVDPEPEAGRPARDSRARWRTRSRPGWASPTTTCTGSPCRSTGPTRPVRRTSTSTSTTSPSPPERDQAVDFSDGYYDLTQALMVLKGSPIEHATTMAEIKDAIFGAQIGTTSLAFINTVIQPTKDAKVFDSTSDAKAALRNGTVDGLVLGPPDRVLRGVHQHAERRARGTVPERGRAPRPAVRGREPARGHARTSRSPR